MSQYFAAIEAGGTKFNCAVLDEQRTIVAQHRILTTVPEATISAVINFFQSYKTAGHDYSGLGIASFGPLDLDPGSDTYGFITATTKASWSNTSLLAPIAYALDCPSAIDTDVNGAALAEYQWGAGKGKDVVVYITVGTGVGGGAVINGLPMKGLIHPEMGHMSIPGIEGINGQCPFHDHCVEGYGAGKSMEKIWDQNPETFADNHPAWEVESSILAQFCHNLLLTFSPHKLILGGGVMQKLGLLEAVIEKTKNSLQGYLTLPQGAVFEDIIVSPGLGQNSGLFGAYALATTCRVAVE